MVLEEQHAALGRLAMERVELRRTCALLESEAARIINASHEASSEFLKVGLSFTRPKAFEYLDKAVDLGGLDRLKAVLAERESVASRLREVEGLATKAGI